MEGVLPPDPDDTDLTKVIGNDSRSATVDSDRDGRPHRLESGITRRQLCRFAIVWILTTTTVGCQSEPAENEDSSGQGALITQPPILLKKRPKPPKATKPATLAPLTNRGLNPDT